MNFSVVILAGGRSTRMGRDKAWLEVGGQTLLSRQIQLAQELGATEVFISGRAGVDYTGFGGRVVLDNYPDSGPLAGIESAQAVTATPLLLALAVDMPAINIRLLQGLYSVCEANCGAIPRVNGRIEPLVAFYPKTAHALAVEMLSRKPAAKEAVAPGPTDFACECVKRKLARFVEASAAEAACFRNLNAPEDLP